jgi:hypothetical protein
VKSCALLCLAPQPCQLIRCPKVNTVLPIGSTIRLLMTLLSNDCREMYLLYSIRRQSLFLNSLSSQTALFYDCILYPYLGTNNDNSINSIPFSCRSSEMQCQSCGKVAGHLTLFKTIKLVCEDCLDQIEKHKSLDK